MKIIFQTGWHRKKIGRNAVNEFWQDADDDMLQLYLNFRPDEQNAERYIMFILIIVTYV